MTTMRKRVLSIRLADAEYQALKKLADQAGTSVPLYIRRCALDSPRLDTIERLIRAVPDRTVLLEVAQRLGKKIDIVAGKGATP